MSTIIALTSSGVEEVTPVNADKMRELALWLCQDEENACMRFWEARGGTSIEELDRRYEEQRKENGGFCNHCRDFAAELLVKSPLAGFLGGDHA